jgi:thiol-disulfide isomerase/thioredoxin
MALANKDLGKIKFHREPRDVTKTSFETSDFAKQDVADFRDKFLLLNFWALWCAPCVKEMPALDRLKATLKNKDFEIITLATGRNSITKVQDFFEENRLMFLKQYFDPKSEFAKASGISVLPTTLMINYEGKEVARVEGIINWDSPDSKKLFLEWLEIR